jgi:putative membrane-bound dehydrogenase-like protein
MLYRTFCAAGPVLAASMCALCGLFAGRCLSAELPAKQTGSDVRLERVPPKSPRQALETFEIADGFRVEQVAAEPLVIDPVAMAFDEQGRLFVVEMRDYSEQDKARLGRVRQLVDDDGDGRFDTSHVFVDDLSWPTAITCYDGGVFIGNPPEVLYCKDTDGDHIADVRRVVFTGFGRSNVQGLLNSLQWGLDQRIHGATSSSGGTIKKVVSVSRKVGRGSGDGTLDLRGRDFSFDPRTFEMATATGGGQHGLTFNRWGDRFVCHNSDHLQAIVFEERYLARNPYQSVAAARRSIAADGPQAAVYRASPVETWRIARTQMRAAGLASGPLEGGGRSAGYFTSATGITVYEGGLWRNDDAALVYVADVGSNLIHRKRLTPHGVTYRGERIDENTEFLRSTDIWFRPVQMAIGPEGALYVADMYREVIEHPASLPPELKRQLDLTSGNDRGRIYRIVPVDYSHAAPQPLAKAGTHELVNALSDRNIWRRLTASRLLFERQDPAAAALLRAELSSDASPEGRIAILHALEGCAALAAEDLLSALCDSHPHVHRHALRLSEPLLASSPDVHEKVLAMAADTEPAVQFQLALSLGECDDPQFARALAKLLIRNIGQPDIVDAALTSMASNAGLVLQTLLAEDAELSSPPIQRVLTAIVGQIVRQRHDEDLIVLIDALDAPAAGSPSTSALVKTLGQLPASSFEGGNSTQLAELARRRDSAAVALVRDARQRLEQDDLPLPERAAAIENLAFGSRFADQRQLLDELLSPHEPTEIHVAVLAACAGYDSPAVAELLIARWAQFSPAERSKAAELLLRREAWAAALLRHFQHERIALTTLEPAHVARLEHYPSQQVRSIAADLRGQSISPDRQQVFDAYRSQAFGGGDSANGKLVFEKNCAACHSLDNSAEAIGPNLAAMASRGAESVLFNILVPNGEVGPQFLDYVVMTTDGQVITGMVAGETTTAVTLRNADNKTTTVLRVDIEEMQNTGKSLMPEGFEKVIDQQAMADLLTYLQQAAGAEEKSK